MTAEKRISILDGFRFVAAISVAINHYNYKWDPDQHLLYGLSTYSDRYYAWMKYGYMGVYFFFIISGFVIAYTLHRTGSMGDFWRKRMIRLLPPLLICAVITFIVANALDHENLFPGSKKPGNILFSLTFLKPELIDRVFNTDLGHIDRSYWSLWPEVQFYLLASILFFWNKAAFNKRFAIICIIVGAAALLIEQFVPRSFKPGGIPIRAAFNYINEYLDLMKYLLLFFIGSLFYRIYAGTVGKRTYWVLAVAILLEYGRCDDVPMMIGFTFMLLLFFLFLQRPKALGILNSRLVQMIGMSSYAFYLLHQVIGRILLNRFAGSLGAFEPIAPMLVVALIAAVSIFMYYRIEKPITRFLKKKEVKVMSTS